MLLGVDGGFDEGGVCGGCDAADEGAGAVVYDTDLTRFYVPVLLSVIHVEVAERGCTHCSPVLSISIR